MLNSKLYTWLAYGAVLVGGVCWGLVGIFNVFLLNSIFGDLLARLLYVAVGVGAGYLIYMLYLDKFKKTPTI